MKRPKLIARIMSTLALCVLMSSSAFAAAPPSKNPNDQGIGMQGRIQQPAPTDAPTISIPSDNAVFTDLPITVSGLCTDGLLVRIFKNNVFGGSVMCDGGSYTLQMDLFPGQNTLLARQYDDLDQVSPDSNARTVLYDIPITTIPGSPDEVQQRITLTSTIARQGVDPNVELVWPIGVSGGTAPYAISVDWGDGKTDLMTQGGAGTLNIKHTYARSGVYKLIVKGTDKSGESSFLQLVVIVNGQITTAGTGDATGPTVTRIRVLWQPAAICIPLLFTTFWLGKRYQLKKVRYRMKHRILPIDK